jgi:hypothetical protein
MTIPRLALGIVATVRVWRHAGPEGPALRGESPASSALQGKPRAHLQPIGPSVRRV